MKKPKSSQSTIGLTFKWKHSLTPTGPWSSDIRLDAERKKKIVNGERVTNGKALWVTFRRINI